MKNYPRPIEAYTDARELPNAYEKWKKADTREKLSNNTPTRLPTGERAGRPGGGKRCIYVLLEAYKAYLSVLRLQGKADDIILSCLMAFGPMPPTTKKIFFED